MHSLNIYVEVDSFPLICIFTSVGMIILGAFIAGARDLSFDSHGYTIVLISNICTAVYLSSIARIGSVSCLQLHLISLHILYFLSVTIFSGKTSDLNSFGLMWCNGILCGPILLLCAFVSGDFKELMNFPYLFSSGFQVPISPC